MSCRHPATGCRQQASLVRPGTGAEARPDRPFDYCLGSKSEVSALSVGTYWFPGIVYEITLGPRLASLGSNDQSRNRSAPIELWCGPQATWSNDQVAPEIPTRRARPGLEALGLTTELPGSLTLGVPGGDRLPLVVGLLALRQGDLDLRSAVLELHRQRHDC